MMIADRAERAFFLARRFANYDARAARPRPDGGPLPNRMLVALHKDLRDYWRLFRAFVAQGSGIGRMGGSTPAPV